LKPTDKAKLKGPALQFPVAFGAITVSYNLSGVKSGIKLDGPTIGSIFMGKIKTWNDAAIKALNPGMSLPSTSITVVHRSDSSGTTSGFTKFLAATDPAWKSSVGTGKDVKWPIGTGAKGNSGVAAAVKQTAGAIGYVEQAYALENGFTYAAVKNSGGQFILPTIQNTSAAANGIKVPPDLGISTINSPAPGAYPIVSQTFIDTYKDPCKSGGASSGTASALKKFLNFAVGKGQTTLGPGSNQLPYAPLPSSLQSKDMDQLGKLTCNGSPVS
jgi:phosphate transport system substrate-binding protein